VAFVSYFSGNCFYKAREESGGIAVYRFGELALVILPLHGVKWHNFSYAKM